MKTICFTGHRPKVLCGYNREAYKQFVIQLSDIIEKYIENENYIRFITGGAQGFDQLAFWAVNNVRNCFVKSNNQTNIENIVYVPFPNQCKMWRKDGTFGQKEYQLMLKHATEVHYVNSDELEGRKALTHLMLRNHAMVDISDLVIALYEDDNWDTSSGGTAECMRYAKQHNKPILQLYYVVINNELRITKTKLHENKQKEK